MALEETIDAVNAGVPPMAAKLKNNKSNLAQRVLGVMKNDFEYAMRTYTGLKDEKLPEGYSVTKSFFEDVTSPVRSLYQRAQEKRKMPMGKQAVEHIKDAKDIVQNVAKVPVRVGASVIDSARIIPSWLVSKQTEHDVTKKPLKPFNVPGLGEVKTYQRDAAESVAKGEHPALAIVRTGSQAILETAAVGQFAKTQMLKRAQTYKETMKQVNSKTRGHSYDTYIKEGDMKMSDVYAKKNILTEKAAKGIVTDYAGQLDNYAPGLGAKFMKGIDMKNVKYIKGQAPEVLKHARKVLEKELGASVPEAVTITNAMSKGAFREFVPAPSVKIGGHISPRFYSEIEMQKRGEIMDYRHD